MGDEKTPPGPDTVVFWGSEIWLEIFAQNPGFAIVKLEKKINSEGKLWQVLAVVAKDAFR